MTVGTQAATSTRRGGIRASRPARKAASEVLAELEMSVSRSRLGQLRGGDTYCEFDLRCWLRRRTWLWALLLARSVMSIHTFRGSAGFYSWMEAAATAVAVVRAGAGTMCFSWRGRGANELGRPEGLRS